MKFYKPPLLTFIIFTFGQLNSQHSALGILNILKNIHTLLNGFYLFYYCLCIILLSIVVSPIRQLVLHNHFVHSAFIFFPLHKSLSPFLPMNQELQKYYQYQDQLRTAQSQENQMAPVRKYPLLLYSF